MSILQELQYIKDLSQSKAKKDLNWADGVDLIGKKIDLFLPKYRVLLSRALISSGKVGSTGEWLFVDTGKLFKDIVDIGEEGLKTIFGNNSNLKNQFVKLAKSDFIAGKLGLITTNNDIVQSIVSLNVWAKATSRSSKLSPTYKIETAISRNNSSIKVYETYAEFIKQTDKILVTESQSEGGVQIWKKLSKIPGIVVHGWDVLNNSPINLGPSFSDESETHVSADELYSTDSEYKSDKSEHKHLKDTYHGVLLVASKKKGIKK